MFEVQWYNDSFDKGLKGFSTKQEALDFEAIISDRIGSMFPVTPFCDFTILRKQKYGCFSEMQFTTVMQTEEN
jgi:hypothetical protein